MALANDSVLVTPGVGASIATHTPAGSTAEYQVVMVADSSGHVQGSFPTYLYSSPPIAVGASKLYVDLFNATGSGKTLMVRGIWLQPKMDVAVTSTVATRLDLFRTSNVGTGGTAASVDSATADPAGGNFIKMDENNAALPAGVTARVTAAGGATNSRWLFSMNVMPEEASTSMGYMNQFFNMVPDLKGFGQAIAVRENTGICIRQNAVASVGNTAILIAFTLE